MGSGCDIALGKQSQSGNDRCFMARIIRVSPDRKVTSEVLNPRIAMRG